MGMWGRVSRNTLAQANLVRDWRIYADFAQVLIRVARSLYAGDAFYALDATTVDLCVSLFPWAQFRRHKSSVKLHALLDLRGNIPTVVIVTSGRVHHVHFLDQIVWDPGAIYLQMITLNNPIPKRKYPERFRPIPHIDPDTRHCFVFLTNSTLLPARTR
jgi:hypothetical protein